MESLFKVSDLETRFGVNMNVIDATGTPRVLGLRACLIAFLDHRRVVLVRQSNWRLERIEKRLHLLEGLKIAFLNLDEVIRIIREESKPREVLMARFTLTEVQADYILDTRLRQLARLEEMTIQDEHKKLMDERDGITTLLASEKLQWKRIDQQLVEVRKQLLSARRTTFADAPANFEIASIESYLPKEPVTVILSTRGWIRAAKGRVEDPSELKFKEGDALHFLVPAMSTDKVLILTSDGRFLTLGCDKLPSARGHGEPLRLMLDIEENAKIVTMFVFTPGAKRFMIAKNGYGFVMNEDDAVANKRAGKQVLNVDGTEAFAALPVNGDMVVVLGDNNKLLVYPLAEMPEMARGKGVKLQAYKGGNVRDIAVFDSASGHHVGMTARARRANSRTSRTTLGKRAGAGKIAAARPAASCGRNVWPSKTMIKASGKLEAFAFQALSGAGPPQSRRRRPVHRHPRRRRGHPHRGRRHSRPPPEPTSGRRGRPQDRRSHARRRACQLPWPRLTGWPKV